MLAIGCCDTSLNSSVRKGSRAKLCFVKLRPEFKWVFSSAGRAVALQATGRRFDPCNTHHLLSLQFDRN